MGLMMRYKTIRDLIESASQTHDTLSEKYRDLELLVTSEKTLWLLEYLNRHEARMAETFKAAKDQLNGMGDLPLALIPEWSGRDLAGELECADMNDVDSIINRALEVDGVVLEGLRCARDQTQSPECRELMQHLINMASNEQKRVAASLVKVV